MADKQTRLLNYLFKTSNTITFRKAEGGWRCRGLWVFYIKSNRSICLRSERHLSSRRTNGARRVRWADSAEKCEDLKTSCHVLPAFLLLIDSSPCGAFFFPPPTSQSKSPERSSSAVLTLTHTHTLNFRICCRCVGRKIPQKAIKWNSHKLSCFLVINLGHYILIRYLMKVKRTEVL